MGCEPKVRVIIDGKSVSGLTLPLWMAVRPSRNCWKGDGGRSSFASYPEVHIVSPLSEWFLVYDGGCRHNQSQL